jgi:5-methylcytosine-specific restriction protein A
VHNGGGRCDQHKRQQRSQSEERRGSSSERGYGYRWQKARATWLSRNPLCVACHEAGRVAPAVVVDHKVPHRGDQTLFWDTSNWQSLCKCCHDTKTAREDGGFGRTTGD